MDTDPYTLGCVENRTPDAEEAREAARLADSLLLLASEQAEARRLSEGAVLGALTVALGRVAGSVARQNGQTLDRFSKFVVRHFRRVAKMEFARRPLRLH